MDQEKQRRKYNGNPQEKNKENRDITLFGLFATAVTLVASLVYQYSKDVLTAKLQICMNTTICESLNITIIQEYNMSIHNFLSEYVLIAVFSLFMMISFMWAYVYSEDKTGKINRDFFRDTAGEFLDSFIILSISVVIGLSQVSTKNNLDNIMGIISGITLWVVIFFVIFIMLIYWTMGKFNQIFQKKSCIFAIISSAMIIMILLYLINRLKLFSVFLSPLDQFIKSDISDIILFVVIIIFIIIARKQKSRIYHAKLLVVVVALSLVFLGIANEVIYSSGNLFNSTSLNLSLSKSTRYSSGLNLSELYIVIFIVKFVIDNTTDILCSDDEDSKSNNDNQRKPDNDNKPDNGWTCFEICVRPKDP